MPLKRKSFENPTKNNRKINFRTLILSVSVGIFAIILFYKINNLRHSCKRLKYWSVKLKDFNDYLPSFRSHHRVFKRMNFEFVNASHGDDWDILWTREYPFYFNESRKEKLFKPLKDKKLLKHQKINHFPDTGALIAKDYMNELNRNQNFILPSFNLPSMQKLLDEFIAKNPHKKILEKHTSNRGVKIIAIKNLKPKENHFYQEFMDNPFLIDGHALDFGVFVLITSFDPIRAYRYSDDVLIRFCTEKYHPFDAKKIDKYVVRDGSLLFAEMPSFAKFYEKYKFSAKSIFEKLISSQGFDIEAFWKRIDRAIGILVQNAEFNVLKETKRLNYSITNFFELLRFDIILDTDLNPYVVEVNMSPNLTPAAKKYEENALLYEQLIFNVVKMIGGGSYHEFWSRFDDSDVIISNYKNLATSMTNCIKKDCNNNCIEISCQICHPCMTSETRYHLREAFREKQNSENFKRVFPTENHFNDEKLTSKMTKNNRVQMEWLKGKCEDDKKWC